MRTKTTATLVTALAVVGLLVSITAAWSGLTAGPEDRTVQSGRAVSERAPAVLPQIARDALDGAAALQTVPKGLPEVTGLPRVGRSDATRVGRATEQRSTPRPVRARLGDVEINAAVRPVGVQRDGQMALPDDPRVLGWYRYSSAPGTGRGATVLAGHLDADGFGLGPLVRLRDVELGDTVEVRVAGGATRAYEVSKVRRFDRQGLPDSLFSRSGPERLHVITCGGAYDAANGGYQENLVVTAVPVT